MAEEPNLETALAEPLDEDDIIILPSFSVIIPTWGDAPALERTLANLVTQSCEDLGMHVPRDFHVVGDGMEEEVKKVCEAYLEKLKPLPHIRIGYTTLDEHKGNGNICRNVGLKQAVADWVVFIDTGTAVCRDFFSTMVNAVVDNPGAKFITWDMVQLLDPVPFLTNAKAIYSVDRSNGLPYVFPGCATAVRRDVAQSIEWPVIAASDWVYFSLLWDKLYLRANEETGVIERIDTPELVDKEVVTIPWTMTVAYGTRTERKWRIPPTEEDIQKLGWTFGFNQAREMALKAQSESKRENSEPVSGSESTHS